MQKKLLFKIFTQFSLRIIFFLDFSHHSIFLFVKITIRLRNETAADFSSRLFIYEALSRRMMMKKLQDVSLKSPANEQWVNESKLIFLCVCVFCLNAPLCSPMLTLKWKFSINSDLISITLHSSFHIIRCTVYVNGGRVYFTRLSRLTWNIVLSLRNVSLHWNP